MVGGEARALRRTCGPSGGAGGHLRDVQCAGPGRVPETLSPKPKPSSHSRARTHTQVCNCGRSVSETRQARSVRDRVTDRPRAKSHENTRMRIKCGAAGPSLAALALFMLTAFAPFALVECVMYRMCSLENCLALSAFGPCVCIYVYKCMYVLL